MQYREEGTPLLIIAGKEYGTGSSRDWAAKGTLLLGVRAVIAESFERIHRSNLVGMGVLPLQFAGRPDSRIAGPDRLRIYSIEGDSGGGGFLRQIATSALRPDDKTFEAVARIDTPVEAEYYRNGGILPYVLRQLAQQ